MENLQWIPGHAGVDGNEAADRLANKVFATCPQEATPVDLPSALTAVRHWVAGLRKARAARHPQPRRTPAMTSWTAGVSVPSPSCAQAAVPWCELPCTGSAWPGTPTAECGEDTVGSWPSTPPTRCSCSSAPYTVHIDFDFLWSSIGIFRANAIKPDT